MAAGAGGRVALHWEGNDEGECEAVTYTQLLERVCQLANYLQSCGVGVGDRVLVYLPMRCELPIAMLACARLGAIHSVVCACPPTRGGATPSLLTLRRTLAVGGFSAEAVAQRIIDCRPKVVITGSAVKRGAKPIPLKSVVDAALVAAAKEGVTVPRVLVAGNEAALSRAATPWTQGRDEWWDEAVGGLPQTAPVAWVDAEHPLFMLYTSGSTGTPKGVVHSSGGFMVYSATTFKHAFDYRSSDVYFCTADCGWITGHSYLTYGPMLMGATQILFEGVPTHPDAGRLWRIVDKYAVSLFYTAPTAVRSLQRLGDLWLEGTSRASLRVLGSVGEPINPEAWRWYAGVVGGGRCAVVDTFWQTETGGHVITPLPGATPAKPGAASLPFFGIDVAIMGKDGVELAGNDVAGVVCVRRPWPGLARTIHGDHARYLETYMRPFPGFYFTGDGGVRDRDGYIWITGRVDDVLNVSGHRLGSAELESALVLHAKVAEAAVIGFPHDTKGEGICCYVTLKDGIEETPAVAAELRAQVRKVIGPFATPDLVILTSGLPKTRSGKIMRRVLRKIVAQQTDQLGDISTLADTGVVHELIRKVEAALGVKLPPLA